MHRFLRPTFELITWIFPPTTQPKEDKKKRWSTSLCRPIHDPRHATLGSLYLHILHIVKCFCLTLLENPTHTCMGKASKRTIYRQKLLVKELRSIVFASWRNNIKAFVYILNSINNIYQTEVWEHALFSVLYDIVIIVCV